MPESAPFFLPANGTAFTSDTAHHWNWYLSNAARLRAPSRSFGVPWTSYLMPGKASFKRFSIREIARCVMSIPIHSRLSFCAAWIVVPQPQNGSRTRSEEHTSELQSLRHLVCRLLLEK